MVVRKKTKHPTVLNLETGKCEVDYDSWVYDWDADDKPTGRKPRNHESNKLR